MSEDNKAPTYEEWLQDEIRFLAGRSAHRTIDLLLGVAVIHQVPQPQPQPQDKHTAGEDSSWFEVCNEDS